VILGQKRFLGCWSLALVLETGIFVEKGRAGSVVDVSEGRHCIVGFDAVTLLGGITRAFGS
jgi:hypothetical protein